jgi:hypothetical protein
VTADIADVEDRLYGADLDEFVKERTAAAKELRADGRRADAAAAAKLPKPSVAAWIVNRLARGEARRMDQLLDAGAKLREIQLGAGSAADLRAAGEAQEAALRPLMRAAEGVAGSRGSATSATLDRVRETLHAAALDAELAEQVRRGVVVREQRAVGFPMGLTVPEERRRPAAAKQKPAAKASAKARQSKAARPQRRDEVGAKRRERAATAAEEAQEALATAESDLASAREELESAEDEVEDARTALSDAERRAKDARRAADGAEKAHAKATKAAKQALERLRALD